MEERRKRKEEKGKKRVDQGLISCISIRFTPLFFF